MEEQRMIHEICEEFLKEAKKDGLSRRDALKIFALATSMVGVAPLSAQAAQGAHAKSTAKGKILIIGGGGGGIDTAARLLRELENPDITLIDPSDIHYYQPGYTLIGCGVYQENDVIKKQADFMPSGVKWIKDWVVELDADAQMAKTKGGEQLKYDYLILAPGLQMNFSALEGITREDLGKDDVNCIYDFEGAKRTWISLQKIAKNGGGKLLFTDINTPIKCGGAPKKINLMAEDYLRIEGLRAKCDISLYTASDKLFGVPEFDKRLGEIYKERDIKVSFNTLFKGVDRATKEAIFERTTFTEKREYDEILKEETVEKVPHVEIIREKFDFLHFTPPMSAPDFVKVSKLAWTKGSAAEGGWAMVDKNTLQHMTYKNVFAIGDVAGIPINKTGGSVRKQAPVVVRNLIDVMEGKEPSASHNGYTVCPILTNYGKVLLAEFGYDNVLLPSLPLLEPAQERWMWWVMKKYILHPLYYYGMLKGIA
ncbi:MAG: NAD(P)/FAD-dependent oxidoreductase [Wolinella sp.]